MQLQVEKTVNDLFQPIDVSKILATEAQYNQDLPSKVNSGNLYKNQILFLSNQESFFSDYS